ncbi:hypothetical protein SELMODRAFT_157819 [Selaginella moellendorffii]|uniref:NnrU domain-containing protein n=1 Tax=Selaginella moellendorffii TaxID=88036 RepID=D8SS38_SELML|nr:15-cis-zeta-carotene isomerase, chloroplastic [Selaginella moellendorffii]EFJ12753.1 hypothetical protein SELMODRAFT_157819 [Selaginella moellendorffii]|eukprot:XP_002986222.1 15-cis-zeta-carotene isomerase, chloroplastic [Selaginella moellendorffii]
MAVAAQCLRCPIVARPSIAQQRITKVNNLGGGARGFGIGGAPTSISRRYHGLGRVLVFARVSNKSEVLPSASADDQSPPPLVGEDSAVFELQSQKLSSWLYFTAILAAVTVVLYFAWLDPTTGYGTAYVDWLSTLTNNSPELVITAMLAIFALVHSGLASFRDRGEQLIGERAYRVVFAGLSLPLAVSAVVYFINHRYEGAQLWHVQDVPGVHQLVWLLSFTSFFFLYPSTFNLLEVAAVDKPKLHMWETGIMRITRHPQMVGQFMWCFAHTLWIGSSFTLTTSIGLLAHHLFGVWNGDRRLSLRYGDAFETVKQRTSVVPFVAIAQGRQKLPRDFYKEFLRLPYLIITALTLGAYFSHPLLRLGSSSLHW